MDDQEMTEAPGETTAAVDVVLDETDPSVKPATPSAEGGLAEEAAPLPKVFSLHFSAPGLVVAALFFALSLFPSLLPRTALFQGLVSGVTIMVGYGLGAFGSWLWKFLGIPPLRGRARTITVWVLVGLVALINVSAIWQHVGWQNDVRNVFGMDHTSVTRWLPILGVTLAIAVVILIISRSIWKLFAWLATWLDRVMPQRVAATIVVAVLGVFFYFLITGVVVNAFFGVANALFSTRDTATTAGVVQPTSELRSGSPASASSWETLGRQGRNFVGTGPTIDELNEFSGGGAVEPIRVYAGLKSAPTIAGRAQLVLDELIRTGAFDREVLVVATTTGTGFLDEDGVDPLEFIYNGDTAIAGVQYSYLPSWISLLADQEITKQTSQIVFDTVQSYWSTLPEDSRPELYLYGLSLGSFGVESILNSINIVNEPIDGALMVGPPFVNPLHAQLEKDRDPGTAPYMPIYEDGRTVRFTSQENGLAIPTAEWGPTRLVYLQHGSDPVVFFSPDLALTPPDWLSEDDQRAPDVSDQMVWVPLVTMWQVAADLPAAGSVPEGFAHLYNLSENAVAWIAVTQPDGWTDADTDRLLDLLAARQAEREAG
jgi:uncharacterized membrane protein